MAILKSYLSINPGLISHPVSAPSSFVNITYHSTSSSSSYATTFVAAQPCPTNYIHAHLRPRGPSFAPQLRTLVTTIMALWAEHISHGKPEGRLDDAKGLHNVFIFEDLAAGAEQGIVLPKAGEEEGWARENWEEMERRSKEGDEGMERLMADLKKS
jgi:hypothetical protein